MSVRVAGPIALACLLMLAVSVVAGCGGGGPSEEEVAAERTRLSALLSSEIAAQQRMAAVKAARADEASCRAQIGRALSQLAAEPQWLSKPDNLIILFDTYRTSVEAIDTELGRIPRESLDKGCLRALGALTAVEETHKEVVQTWAQCVFEHFTCDTIPHFWKDYFEILRLGWQEADIELKTAQKLVRAIGTHPKAPAPASPFLPRSESSVKGSLVGLIAQDMCSSSASEAAVKPCQSLHDLLADGVSEDEEAGLNTALSGIASAYGLGTPAAETTTAG